MERVLVCVLSQTRAHQLTWKNFKRHVLDELEADLALCIGVDENYDYANPFWQHARFRWTAPEFADFGDGFDQAQKWLATPNATELPDWREILKIKDQWLGGIKGKEAHPGSGAIVIYFRWLLLRNLIKENLLEEYDRIVVTRSDHLWNVPHPPLSILSWEHIWVPDGEHYQGLCDRHLVANPRDLPKIINLIDDVVLKPDSLAGIMSHHRFWNPEKYFALHLKRRGLTSKVKVFPYVTFMVRSEADSTRWSRGKLDNERGMIVKYQSELQLATTYETIIRTRHDWEALANAKPHLFRPMWAAEGETVGKGKEILLLDQGGTIRNLEARSLDSAGFSAFASERYRFLSFALANCRRSKAQLFQDLWVAFELSSQRGGFFVEFGAGDGITNSNSYLLETEYGWTGVVAEPNPVYHNSLLQNRRCYVSTKCIASVSHDTVSFIQTQDPGYSTIEKYRSADMHAEARKEGVKIIVETITLADLLIEAKAPKRIDYLSIDTEGSELEILEKFDFSAYDVRIISVEHNFTQQREKIHELLESHGYKRKFVEFSRWDDWYVKFGGGLPDQLTSTRKQNDETEAEDNEVPLADEIGITRDRGARPLDSAGAASSVPSRAEGSRAIKRALIVIPHYFDLSASSDEHRHDSRRPASVAARAQALEQVIVNLHELFGRHRWGCLTHTLSCERFENPDALDLTIVVCTVGDAHLLQHLTCSDKLYTIVSFDLDPQWLGLGAHAVIRDNIARGYDWFVYLEDDLLIEDPKFFAKLEYFHRVLDERVGTDALLLPMRYETVRDLEAPEKLPFRLYCDYRAGDRPLHDGPAILVRDQLGDITLEPARHPHGGCFFLDRKRAEIFVASPYCASAAKIWTTPLDTAATVAIWSSFRLYKPAANSLGVLDIRHLRPAMLRRFAPRLVAAGGAMPAAPAVAR